MLVKTIDNDNYIRIENNDGAAITILKNKMRGQLLSIVVPEDDRGQGIGKELLSAAEQELKKKGFEYLDCDFSSSMEALIPFFGESGFATASEAPVLTVPVSAIINSPIVKKALSSKAYFADYHVLSEVSFAEWDYIFNGFEENGILIGDPDIARLDQDLSGVVFDEDSRLRAALFCSDSSSGLHIDFLVGFGKNASMHILTAVSGMFSALKKHGREGDFERLTAIAAVPTTEELLTKALGNDKKPEKDGRVLHLRKSLLKTVSVSDVSVDLQITEDSADKWRREIRKIPLQANISYKMPWSRLKEKIENLDEQSGDIDFDKKEDETEGLSFKSTLRITAANKDEFADFLPPDIFQDISRPFFKGLVMRVKPEDEPEAIMVWKLINIEDSEESEAKIEYFSMKTEQAGEVLLMEYAHEIESLSVARSYYELEDLPDGLRSLLETYGFIIDRRESCDLVVTASSLGSNIIIKGKPTRYAVSLKSVSVKQFKKGLLKATFFGKNSFTDDIAFLPKGWFDPEISACYVMDDEIKGMLLMHRCASGCLFVDMLLAMGGDPQAVILNLIRYSYRVLRDKYPDLKMIIRRRIEMNRKLSDRLFPGKEGKTVFYGIREETGN